MTTLEGTRARIQRVALTLFAQQGFDATSVNQVASAAGVSHMTFFRYFPTKESAVVDDVFDPVIAEAVRAQPTARRPLTRAVRGLLAAMSHPEAVAEMGGAEFRSRIHLASSTPALRAAARRAAEETEQAICAVLQEGGAAPHEAAAAAAAVIAAATSLLLSWAAADGDGGAVDVLGPGLESLLGGRR